MMESHKINHYIMAGHDQVAQPSDITFPSSKKAKTQANLKPLCPTSKKSKTQANSNPSVFNIEKNQERSVIRQICNVSSALRRRKQ